MKKHLILLTSLLGILLSIDSVSAGTAFSHAKDVDTFFDLGKGTLKHRFDAIYEALIATESSKHPPSQATLNGKSYSEEVKLIVKYRNIIQDPLHFISIVNLSVHLRKLKIYASIGRILI